MEFGPALIDGSSSRPRPGRRPTGTSCDVRLTLTAHAEQVVLVRSVVGALAVSLGFPDRGVNDVRLAVTEACTNVVRHAYPDVPGSLDVAASVEAERLTVIVADHGCGLRPRAVAGTDVGGLGLPLMAALTERMNIEETDGQGTTVRLSFSPAE